MERHGPALSTRPHLSCFTYMISRPGYDSTNKQVYAYKLFRLSLRNPFYMPFHLNNKYPAQRREVKVIGIG